jgi:hypothetical protein
MTLVTGNSFNSIGREIFGYAPQINFADGGSGDSRTAFDFTSPQNRAYMVEMTPSVDSSAMAAGDIISYIIQGNGLNIYGTKFALTVAKEPIASQLPEIKFILPPNTQLLVAFILISSAGMIGSAFCMFRGVEFG